MSEQTYEKPPFGVRPRWLVDEQRVQDLAEAIVRYAHAGLLRKNAQSMADWAEEITDIANHYVIEGLVLGDTAIEEPG